MYQLLTLKPRLYLINGREEEVSKDILEIFNKNNWAYLIIDILAESDAIDLNPQEREEFGLPQKLHIDKLIESSYKLLNLITFLTTGKDETRAWVLKNGGGAPQAGGVIHSDFEKHFIKAEVISWRDLLDSGSIAKAREKGLIRTEGKEYVVKDGDVIEIKSNA